MPRSRTFANTFISQPQRRHPMSTRYPAPLMGLIPSLSRYDATIFGLVEEGKSGVKAWCRVQTLWRSYGRKGPNWAKYSATPVVCTHILDCISAPPLLSVQWTWKDIPGCWISNVITAPPGYVARSLCRSTAFAIIRGSVLSLWRCPSRLLSILLWPNFIQRMSYYPT